MPLGRALKAAMSRRRHDVPETSHAALRWVRAHQLPRHLVYVLRLVIEAGATGITAERLVELFDVRHGTHSTSTGHPARKRLSDLKSLGLVWVCGRVVGASGRLVEVYRVSPSVPSLEALEKWRASKRSSVNGEAARLRSDLAAAQAHLERYLEDERELIEQLREWVRDVPPLRRRLGALVAQLHARRAERLAHPPPP